MSSDKLPEDLGRPSNAEEGPTIKEIELRMEVDRLRRALAASALVGSTPEAEEDLASKPNGRVNPTLLPIGNPIVIIALMVAFLIVSLLIVIVPRLLA